MSDENKLEMDPELALLDDESLARTLLTVSLRDLVNRIQKGVATAADLNVARAYCKDLNIQMVPKPGNSAGQLGKAVTDGLPYAGDTAGQTYQ